MIAKAAIYLKSAALWLMTPRSPAWAHVRYVHLLIEAKCQWCGGSEDLAVHHIVMYHLDKSKELDSDNLITLCMAPGKKCHYRQGHMGVSWLVADPDIREKCNKHQQKGEYMELVQKILAIVTAVKASDWPTTIRLTLEVLKIIADGFLPQPIMATSTTSSQPMKAAFQSAESMSVEDIADELHECCEDQTTVDRPFIDLILPLLIALARKLLLGF